MLPIPSGVDVALDHGFLDSRDTQAAELTYAVAFWSRALVNHTQHPLPGKVTSRLAGPRSLVHWGGSFRGTWPCGLSEGFSQRPVCIDSFLNVKGELLHVLQAPRLRRTSEDPQHSGIDSHRKQYRYLLCPLSAEPGAGTDGPGGQIIDLVTDVVWRSLHLPDDPHDREVGNLYSANLENVADQSSCCTQHGIKSGMGGLDLEALRDQAAPLSEGWSLLPLVPPWLSHASSLI